MGKGIEGMEGACEQRARRVHAYFVRTMRPALLERNLRPQAAGPANWLLGIESDHQPIESRGAMVRDGFGELDQLIASFERLGHNDGIAGAFRPGREIGAALHKVGEPVRGGIPTDPTDKSNKNGFLIGTEGDLWSAGALPSGANRGGSPEGLRANRAKEIALHG